MKNNNYFISTDIISLAIDEIRESDIMFNFYNDDTYVFCVTKCHHTLTFNREDEDGTIFMTLERGF